MFWTTGCALFKYGKNKEKAAEYIRALTYDPQIWKERNKAGVTPLFAAEGYIGRLPRPDKLTIEAVTRLMVAAGLSTEGERPAIVDIYEKPAEPPQKAKPVKP